MSSTRKTKGYIETIYYSIDINSTKKCPLFVNIVNYKPKRIKYRKI